MIPFRYRSYNRIAAPDEQFFLISTLQNFLSLIYLISAKGSKGQSFPDRFGARLLHGSVSTAETPDVMCSLETFVTV